MSWNTILTSVIFLVAMLSPSKTLLSQASPACPQFALLPRRFLRGFQTFLPATKSFRTRICPSKWSDVVRLRLPSGLLFHRDILPSAAFFTPKGKNKERVGVASRITPRLSHPLLFSLRLALSDRVLLDCSRLRKSHRRGISLEQLLYRLCKLRHFFYTLNLLRTLCSQR